MTAIENMKQQLRVTDSWKDESGVTWFATGNLDLRELTEFLIEMGARFITITANQLPRDEGFCLDYVWDLDGQLLGFGFYLSSESIASIYDLCEAADWIEREIHEEYAIDFTGHKYEPLLLREGDHPGANLREVVK